MARYEVYPKNGAWHWQKGSVVSKKFKTRGEAVEDARAHRGDDRRAIYDGDGNPLGNYTIMRGPEALVLLREDGSFHSEVDHAVVDGGGTQVVSITPASESSQAGGL